jgi:hypothetical protein
MKFSPTFLFSIAAGSPQRVRRQNDKFPDDYSELSATIDPTDLSTTESFNIEDILLNFQTSPDPFDIFDFLETTKDPIFEELIFTTPQTIIESDKLATTESIDALLATEPSILDILNLETTPEVQFPSELPPVPTEESVSISAILLEGINAQNSESVNTQTYKTLDLNPTQSPNTTTESSIISKIKENFDENVIRLDNFINSVLNSPFLNNEITSTPSLAAQITTTKKLTASANPTTTIESPASIDFSDENSDIVNSTDKSVDESIQTVTNTEKLKLETLERLETSTNTLDSSTLPFEGIDVTENPKIQVDTTEMGTTQFQTTTKTSKIETMVAESTDTTKNIDTTTTNIVEIIETTVTTETLTSTTVTGIMTNFVGNFTDTSEETVVTDTPTTESSKNLAVTQLNPDNANMTTIQNRTTVTTARTLTTKKATSDALRMSISVLAVFLIGILNLI